MKERIDAAKAKSALQPKTPNRFQIAEEKGRQVFNTWCTTQSLTPSFVEDSSSAYDAIVNNHYYEIKYKQGHKYKSLQVLIENEGLMFEEKKFLRLKSIWEQDKTKEFYYWLAFEDVIIIHQIDFTTTYKAKVYACPATSVGSNTQMIDKTCLMIPYDKMIVNAKV